MPLFDDPFSRFSGTSTTLFDGEEVHGKWVMPQTLSRELKDGEFSVFIVDASLEGRPDRISDQFYGSTQLDWLIIAANNARQALNWPRAGDVIKIPSSSIATSELF